MIVLDLVCVAGHRFEGWFASVDAFEDQARKALVNCPYCNHADVHRLPSAPMVARGTAPSKSSSSGQLVDDDLSRIVGQLRRLADISEDVGDMFPEEARRIHHGQVEQRHIRGHASLDEVKGLLEEGIPVLPVPEKKQTH